MEAVKLVWVMTAICVVSSVVVAAFVAPDARREVVLGMVAPLSVALTTLAIVGRAHRRDPRQVTTVMIKAFGVKLVFFGVYVTIALSIWSLQIVPFVISFVTYFVVLHLTEALYLRRLFMTAVPAPPLV